MAQSMCITFTSGSFIVYAPDRGFGLHNALYASMYTAQGAKNKQAEVTHN